MKTVLGFLRQLEQNNNRDWFAAQKPEFEQAKSRMLLLVEEVIRGVASFDKEVGGQQAKDCVFRIYRDTRFSADKTPYKNNMGAWIAPGGKKSPGAGYYLHIQPGASFIAGGVWMPDSPMLQAIRQEIYFRHEEFRKILLSRSFKAAFGEMDDYRLKTFPKGFDKEHPAIDLLRYTSYVVSHSFTDKEVKDPEFASQAVQLFKTMHPFLRFLNEAIGMQE